MKNSQFPPILLVSGKGGVGKTFISVFLARHLAAQGKKVLVVEMGNWSYLQSALELKISVGFRPQSLSYGFDLARWTGEDCLSDYISYIVKVPWLTKPFMENSWMRSLIQVAPGLREIALLGKITSQARQHGPSLNYDHIIVDAVSSGHFLSLLQAPQGLAQVVSVGPMHTQSMSINKTLSDPKQTATILVSNLESYSVQESLETYDQLCQLGIRSITFAANKAMRLPPADMPSSQEAKDFYQTLIKLFNFQEQQKKRLQLDAADYFEVPHFFQPMQNIIGGSFESNRIF